MEKFISRRKFISLAGIATISSAAFLAGCTSAPRGEQNNQEQDSLALAQDISKSPSAGTGKSLIVVYSWSGNTMRMAERLAELNPDADFFRIEPVEAYPNNYDATADRAKQERDEDVIVSYQRDIENWDAYDTIYLGYPIWWYELPQIVKKFISDHDWSDKTIYPFNTHEGSGDGGTPADIQELASGASIGSNLAIRGANVSSSLNQVDNWYAELSE